MFALASSERFFYTFDNIWPFICFTAHHCKMRYIMPKLTPLSFKAPVTQSGDDTAFVQRSENMSARRGVAAKYA